MEEREVDIDMESIVKETLKDLKIQDMTNKELINILGIKQKQKCKEHNDVLCDGCRYDYVEDEYYSSCIFQTLIEALRKEDYEVMING